jgi:hypothetical protein
MNLDNLRRKGDFYRNDAPGWCRIIWSRPQAFDNFIKHQREPLMQAGALQRIGRDLFVDQERFPEIAAAILGIGTDR